MFKNLHLFFILRLEPWPTLNFFLMHNEIILEWYHCSSKPVTINIGFLTSLDGTRNKLNPVS